MPSESSSVMRRVMALAQSQLMNYRTEQEKEQQKKATSSQSRPLVQTEGEKHQSGTKKKAQVR